MKKENWTNNLLNKFHHRPCQANCCINLAMHDTWRDFRGLISSQNLLSG
jgi:hypothetical protein